MTTLPQKSAAEKRGLITNAVFVTCGRCQSEAVWEGRVGFPRVTREILELGWSVTEEHGWICQECTEAHKGDSK